MYDEIYERLADSLNVLPNGFPRTKTGVEIRLLKKIVTPEHAELAGQLTMYFETIRAIAEKAGLTVEDTTRRLQAMMFRGLVWPGTVDGKRGFRLAPFVVGIYEAQFANMDHELAHLFDEYMMQGAAEGILGPQPAVHRVVPVHQAMKTEEIMPYDDVWAMLSEAKSFAVRDCICRIERSFHDHNCRFPRRVCLTFSMQARPTGTGSISQDEALALLEKAEEVGLVHTVSNIADGLGYVCNCCSCCCAILRGITEWGIENSVARANYFAVVEPDLCTNCRLCFDRCHMAAITEQDRTAAVDVAKCIGCGLCVSACPDNLIHLQKRPDAEIVHPPATFEEWEQARLAHRKNH